MIIFYEEDDAAQLNAKSSVKAIEDPNFLTRDQAKSRYDDLEREALKISNGRTPSFREIHKDKSILKYFYDGDDTSKKADFQERLHKRKDEGFWNYSKYKKDLAITNKQKEYGINNSDFPAPQYTASDKLHDLGKAALVGSAAVGAGYLLKKYLDRRKAKKDEIGYGYLY